MTPEQLNELRIAIKRLIEAARDVDEYNEYVKVKRIDFERLNRLAAELPQC